MRGQQQETIIFGGGLDVVTPPQLVPQGQLLECRNYECDLNGGYRQAAGYERFDGRTSPTDSSFSSLETATPSGPMTLGETLTQTTSGATAILLSIGATGIYVVEITGTFDATNVITGGTSGATAVASSLAFENSLLSTSENREDIRYLKEIYYRDLIQEVPGAGPVRGAFRHEGITLAVRDNVGQTLAVMHTASASGWTPIDDSWIMFFDTKGNTMPVSGTTLDDGNGNDAVLHRAGLVEVEGNSTLGYIVLTGYTSGFAAGDNIEDGATVIALVATGGEPALVTLLPGGKNEWRSHSFTGAVDFYRAYTSDGVNPCMEYDPVANVISPIYTDQAYISTDTPTLIAVYSNTLFLGFDRGMMRNSEPGDPFLWDAAAGTVEIHIGSEPTGFDEAPKSLIVTTARTTYALTGQNEANFILDVASARTGAQKYSVQHIGTTHMLDDRGIIELARVQAFGNFENATLSRVIQPKLNEIKNQIIASTTNLKNNIYKLFTADGVGISLTFQEGQAMGFGLYDLNVNINFITNAEDENGDERIFFGGSDGYVFEMDKGRSFDGASKECWLKTVYQHLKSATTRKRFYRAFFDALVDGKASLNIAADYSSGSADVNSTESIQDTITNFKSAWDQGAWGEAVWDTSFASGSAYIDLTGTGDSISLIVYSDSATDDIVTLEDVIYKYKTRRGMRGRK